MQLADTTRVHTDHPSGRTRLTGLLAAALLAAAAMPGHAGTVAIDTLDALGVPPIGVP